VRKDDRGPFPVLVENPRTILAVIVLIEGAPFAAGTFEGVKAVDLVFVARGTVPPSIAIIKRIDSRGQSVLQIARLSVEIA